jgi:hypothetical protein
LFLKILGVTRQDIDKDYLLSKKAPGFLQIRSGIFDRVMLKYGYGIDDTALDALLGVELSYLQAMFDAIERRNGSIENYFVESGLEEALLLRLHHRFVAPVL